MESQGLLVSLSIGAVAGWLAGKMVDGGGNGLIMNIIFGLIGSFVGNYLLTSVLHVNVGGGLVSSILTSAAGAAVVLLILRLFRR